MKYSAERMIAKSRHIHFYLTLDGELRRAAADRVEQLIREEKAYCDRGNYGHLCNLFTAIALYETLQRYGMTEEQAFSAVAEEMHRFIQPKRKRFQRMAEKNWFWPAMKIIVPLGFRLGSGVGWRYTWFKNQPKNSFRFETNECIYQKILEKRGREKLGPLFCQCDVITYGDLPRVDFQRKGTLCYGNEKCDFAFVRFPKGEPFRRSESR